MVMQDFKRNNKVSLRNFNEAVDFHDIVKTLLVRMLRRKHPNSTTCQIYTEHNINCPNDTYPDIQMVLKQGRKQEIYVWELQEDDNKAWEQKIKEQYAEVNLIIVPLKKVSKELWEIIARRDGCTDWLKDLRKILEDYCI